MNHKGTLPVGIELDGKVYRDYTLEEERFRHTLAVYTDGKIAREALNDPAYHAAAILAKRLIIPGIDLKGKDPETKKEIVIAEGKGVTPEMVLDLFPEDGNALGQAGSDIAARRAEFRKAPGDQRHQGE